MRKSSQDAYYLPHIFTCSLHEHMSDDFLSRQILFSFRYGVNPYIVLHTALTQHTHRIPRHKRKSCLKMLTTFSILFSLISKNSYKFSSRPRTTALLNFFADSFVFNTHLSESEIKFSSAVVLGMFLT
jgi:hypothetical protein